MKHTSSDNEITFAVSDVKPGEAPKEHIKLYQALRNEFGSTVESCSDYHTDLVPSENLPGLMRAVHCAFANHYHLEISPDDVWLTILQGVSRHILLHSEELRDKFVDFDGKKEIEVRRDEFVKGSPENPWDGVFEELADKAREATAGRADFLNLNFSTTTKVQEAVANVVLLEAMSEYFDYSVLSLCGIPSITLKGTIEDWTELRLRIYAFDELGMEWWTRVLGEALDNFVAARQGFVNQEWWQSFYKYKSHSGGPYVSGWINALYPYLYAANGVSERGGLILKWTRNPYLNDETVFNRTYEFPTSHSVVPFKWSYQGQKFDYEFLAGVTGVEWTESERLRCVQGWVIRPRKKD